MYTTNTDNDTTTISKLIDPDIESVNEDIK